jgi:hypothetical protein
MTSHLMKSFERARLRLDLPHEPLVRMNADIFQMDIQRRRGAEWFRLWKGAEKNTVLVTDLDLGRRQLMLLVQEPSRSFEETIYKRGLEMPPESHRPFRIVHDDAQQWVFERWTPSVRRRYLCGMDESHLFIAEVPGGTTVRDAHRELKPAEVRDFERSSPGRILRQGEWFFVTPSPVEARLLAAALKQTPWIVCRKESLGGNGRPHVADEVVREGGRVYARGRVRHPDHATLDLVAWRRVHRNAEVRQTGFGSNGVYWID